VRNFSNFFDGYLEYSKGHESTQRVRLWSAVSVVGAALERKVYLDRAYYKLFPNLYTFIIGKSGLIKKSTSTGIAVSLLREVQGVRIMAERLTASSVVEQLLAAGKTVEVNGKRMGQSAVFAYASELAVFLTEVFGSITELLTTFYDCSPHDATKPWVYQTIGRGERKIYGPCLNILGASTKAWLKKCIPNSEMEGGFTSRIIFVVENNLPDELIAWPTLTEENELNRLKLIEDLRSIHAMAGEMKPTDEVKRIFSAWYDNHSRVIIPRCRDARMIGYLSRKGDTILKLSMIHSAATREDLLITKEDLYWGKNELDALEDDWRNAFDKVAIISDISSEMLEFIRTNGCVLKKDVIDEFSRNYPFGEVMKCLRDLKDIEEIKDFVRFDKNQKKEYYVLRGYEESPNLS
jgi:hypothetical protein